jgi:Ni,Fe-hydrogenase III small subunit
VYGQVTIVETFPAVVAHPKKIDSDVVVGSVGRAIEEPVSVVIELTAEPKLWKVMVFCGVYRTMTTPEPPLPPRNVK